MGGLFMRTTNGLQIELTTNCNDDSVYAYMIDGNAIYAPTMSICGRFKVNPYEEYGLTEFDVDFLHQLNVLFDYDDIL